MGINRYDFESYVVWEGPDECWAKADVYKYSEGDYVFYEDHEEEVDKLKAYIQKLEAEVEKLENENTTLLNKYT